jgi:Tol biopolymer transport system component
VGEPDGAMSSPRFSPDGRRVSMFHGNVSNADIWLLDGPRRSRFTFDNNEDAFPIWSPDGSRIVFRSGRVGMGDLYQKTSSGAGVDALLLDTDQSKTPNSWSADGRFLMYHSISPQTARDLWVIPMTGDPVPFAFLQTPFNERWGEFSPDGRWVAFQSDESGRDEVYVRPFDAPDNSATRVMGGGQWQISTAGGVYPVWSLDGKELYYLDPAGNMIATPLFSSGDAIEAGVSEVLFPTRIVGRNDISLGRQYDVNPDGQFLINTQTGEGANDAITLIQNWNPEAAQ